MVARDAARPAGEGAGGHHAPAHRQAQEMKITHVTTRALSTPRGQSPRGRAAEPTDKREFVLLRAGTDQSWSASGLTFFGGALTPALRARWTASPAHHRHGPEPGRGHRGESAGAWRAARARAVIFALALSAVDMPAGTFMGKAAAARSAHCWAACATARRRTRAAR